MLDEPKKSCLPLFSSARDKYTSLVPALLAVFLLTSCKNETPPQPPGVQPGKRDYVWTVDTIAYPGSFQTSMLSIWGSSPQNVFVVGHNELARGKMFRFDGARWTPVELSDGGLVPGGIILSRVTGYSPNSIFAVGEQLYINPTPPPNFLDSSLIIRFDGFQWRKETLDTRGQNVQAISSQGASPKWAGGTYGTLYRYDGSVWRKQVAESRFWFASFSSTSDGDYALAYNSPVQYFLTWQDSSFVVIDSFRYELGFVQSFGENALATIDNSLYSAGGFRVFRHDASGTHVVLEDQSVNFQHLFGTRSAHIFVVGLFGTAYHFDGHSWSRYENLTSNTISFSSVWCTEEEVFILGRDGNRSYVLHGR